MPHVDVVPDSRKAVTFDAMSDECITTMNYFDAYIRPLGVQSSLLPLASAAVVWDTPCAVINLAPTVDGERTDEAASPLSPVTAHHAKVSDAMRRFVTHATIMTATGSCEPQEREHRLLSRVLKCTPHLSGGGTSRWSSGATSLWCLRQKSAKKKRTRRDAPKRCLRRFCPDVVFPMTPQEAPTRVVSLLRTDSRQQLMDHIGLPEQRLYGDKASILSLSNVYFGRVEEVVDPIATSCAARQLPCKDKENCDAVSESPIDREGESPEAVAASTVEDDAATLDHLLFPNIPPCLRWVSLYDFITLDADPFTTSMLPPRLQSRILLQDGLSVGNTDTSNPIRLALVGSVLADPFTATPLPSESRLLDVATTSPEMQNNFDVQIFLEVGSDDGAVESQATPMTQLVDEELFEVMCFDYVLSLCQM